MKLKYNAFTLWTLFLIIILPFYVLLKVFFEIKLWIPKFGFLIKEFVIVLLFFTLVYEYFKKRSLPKFELLDYLIFSYIGYWVIITLIQWLWITSVIFGWRYDFMFLIVFLLYKHGREFLQISIQKLLQIFLISWGISLFFSVLIKFVIWEQTLLFFWFSDYISNWTFNGSVPSYHGLENSGIKRFQWILDSPNAMAFFLIIYGGILIHFHKKKTEFYLWLILVFLFWLVILTYSRSALLWIFSAIWLLIFTHIKFIYHTYKKYFLWIIVLLTFIILIFGYIFQEKIYNAVIRPSSTAGHFARMEIGFNRFTEVPFGQWLAEAGPAFRSIYPEKISKTEEEYYIPESWFIQQLIEWWIIYFFLFLSIFSLILLRLYKISKSIFWILIAILVMNVFLHIFEATYLSILLFVFIWLLLAKK